MDTPQNVSQLTLIKSFSTADKYVVHTHIEGKSFAFELNVDHETSVQSFIQEALSLLKSEFPALDLSPERYVLELYAARKSGRKVSDLPSFEAQQKILKTGQKCFFLLCESRDGSSTVKSGTISTKSIRTEMKPLQLKAKESRAEKQRNCFCFS